MAMNDVRPAWRSCRDNWIIRRVGLPVWAILSCLLLVPSVLALVVSPDGMKSLAHSVAAPHRKCPLCGMTRGYVEMARGDVHAAWEWNRGAPFWFIFGLLNGGAAVIYLAWSWRKRSMHLRQENRCSGVENPRKEQRK